MAATKMRPSALRVPHSRAVWMWGWTRGGMLLVVTAGDRRTGRTGRPCSGPPETAGSAAPFSPAQEGGVTAGPYLFAL